MTTTAVNQSVLETNITIQTLTVSSSLILDDQWQVGCLLIQESLVTTYFIDPGSIITGTFNLLNRNDYTGVVQDALLAGANTFYGQSSNATLSFIVYDDAGWAALTPVQRQQVLTPIAETIQDKTNIVITAIEDATTYVETADAIDIVAKGFDFFTLRIEPVPVDVAALEVLSAYMVTQFKTSIVLNATYTLDNRPDFGGSPGGLQTLDDDRVVGHTWQGNPVVGASATFIEPTSSLMTALIDSPLSFLQRETPDSDAIVYMGGWAYDTYSVRVPLSFLIFNTYSRIQLRNNVLPLITRRETRPITSDDVNAVSAIISTILEPFVGTVVVEDTLEVRSYTPTEIQEAIQSGTLTLVLNEMVKYSLPRVVQRANITIVAETL